MEEKYPSLQNVCFYKAVEVEKTLAILVGHGDVPKLLGYGGKIVKTLGDETGKNVRVLEHGVDDRKFLEEAARIVGKYIETHYGGKRGF